MMLFYQTKMDHTFCYKVNGVCCCKYIDQKLYNIKRYGYDVDEVNVSPTNPSFKQKYSGVINELQELNKRKLAENITISSKARLIKPENTFVENKRVYYVSLKECVLEEVTDKKAKEMKKNYGLFHVKPSESSSKLAKKRKRGKSFYDYVDVDPKKHFKQSKKKSFHSLVICNKRSYYSRLDNTLNGSYDDNYTNDARNPILSPKKKVHFYEEVQVLEFRTRTPESLLKCIKNKLKAWFKS